MNYFRFCFSLLLVSATLLFSSCAKEESPTVLQSPDDPLKEASLRGDPNNCSMNYDDVGVDIEFSEDCSTATLTFSLCCTCNLGLGTQTGCTIPGGKFEVFVLNNSKVSVYTQNVNSISIPSGGCYDIVMQVPTFGKNRLSVTLLSLEGVGGLTANGTNLPSFCVDPPGGL
ncbi:MAG: hypothetical protein ACFB10_00830 [Salibacteraceae bacterium]